MLEEPERRLASLLRRECPEDLHVESVVTHGASVYGRVSSSWDRIDVS
jgi:hypothetical protein